MAKSDLKITVKPGKEHLTVLMVGEAHFDIEFGEERVEEVMGHKPEIVHVDATKLTFISSTGICFLLSLRSAVKQTKGKIHLVGLQPMVQQALQHARVMTLFDRMPEADEPETKKAK